MSSYILTGIQENFESLLQSATTCNYKVRQFVFLQSARTCYYSATAILLQSACDKCYYKVRQVLQSVTILLQSSATGITKYVDYNKVRQ